PRVARRNRGPLGAGASDLCLAHREMGPARRAAAPRHVVRGRRSTREVFSSATDRNRPGREEGTQAPSAGGHRVLGVAPHGGPERLPPSTLRRTSARKAPALRGVVGGKWVIRALADNFSVTRGGRPQRSAPDTHEDAPVSAQACGPLYALRQMYEQVQITGVLPIDLPQVRLLRHRK